MFSWPLWNEISSTNGSSRTLISNSSLFFCVEMISRSANLIRWSLSAPGFYRVSSVYLDGSMDRWRDWSIHREECAVWHSRSRRIGMLPSLSTFVFFFSCVCVCVCVCVCGWVRFVLPFFRFFDFGLVVFVSLQRPRHGAGRAQSPATMAPRSRFFFLQLIPPIHRSLSLSLSLSFKHSHTRFHNESVCQTR